MGSTRNRSPARDFHRQRLAQDGGVVGDEERQREAEADRINDTDRDDRRDVALSARSGESRRRQLLAGGAGLGVSAWLSPWSGAVASDGPLRIVVGYPPGGASDRAARLVAERLQARIGSPVVVENKTGAGGRLSAQLVKATPAGQPTLLMANPALMVVAPIVFKDNGYDARRDFVPVAHVTDYDFGIATGPAVPVREVSHLLAWLRANPTQANFGVPATGSLPHFFGLMLAKQAGVQGQVVGYRGSGPLATDLIGGQIPVAIDTLDVLATLHDAGRLRVLASSGAKRSVLLPAVPTLRESGIDIEATGWNALFAPSSMPAAAVQRWSKAIRDVMKEPATRKAFVEAKMDPVSADAAETAERLRRYRAQWEPVVRDSGFEG